MINSKLKELIHIKNLANSITFSRIICSILLIFTVVFSNIFWILYLYAGISDLLDGFIARKLNQQSDFGEKLDSIADLFFLLSISIVIVVNMKLPIWIWVCIFVIALIRIMSYGIGYKRYGTFSSLHTYANKVTGLMLFTSPILFAILGITTTGIILITLAFISALEELIINIKAKELNRNIKSIFKYIYFK